MKRVLFILAVLAVVSSLSVAQLGISKGIKGGLNMANFGGSDAGGSSGITQFAAGIFVEFNLPGPFAIQPEALYSVKGSKGTALGVEITQTLSYIDIPVLLKYKLPTPGVTPSVYVGPSLGILVGAKAKANGSEVDDKSAFPSSDIGAVFGAAIQLPLGATNLTLDARYDMGLSTLDKSGAAKVYNRVFQILVGISF